MLIRTEQTPNPATRKFLPDQTVMDAGTRDFADAEAAEASPLASALFSSGLVEGVFYGRDFISVTAAPAVALTLFALALIYRDGVLVIFGAAAAIGSVALLAITYAAAWWAAVQMWQHLA